MEFFDFERPYLLFLPGTFLRDCPNLEDIPDADEYKSLQDIRDVKKSSFENADVDSIEIDSEISELDDSCDSCDSPEDDDVSKKTKNSETSKTSKKTKNSSNKIEDEIITDDSEDMIDKINASNTKGSKPMLYNCKEDEIIQYDEIPRYFLDMNSWVKNTNLLCWTCGNGVAKSPWFIPLALDRRLILADATKYDDITAISDAAVLASNKKFREVSVMTVYGNYCTIYCAQRYIIKVDDDKIINKQECERLLKRLYEIRNGHAIDEIPISEDKTKMMQYCGPHGMSAEEFRICNENKYKKYKESVDSSTMNSVQVTFGNTSLPTSI